MGPFYEFLQTRLLRDTRGLSTVEYVIILALIAAVAVGIWQEFGESVATYLGEAKGEIDRNMPTY